MALSDHEKAVRAAVDKTERENKLRAAEFRLEQAEKAARTANDAAGRARDAVKAAQIALDAVKDQIKMAEREAKTEKAVVAAKVPAPTEPTSDPLKEPV